MSACDHCGGHVFHYLSHRCPDCTCRWYDVRVPGEPHIPPMPEMEPDPACPAHGEPTPKETP